MRLSVTNNAIESSKMETFARSLQPLHGSLRHLNIGRNPLGAAGLLALSRGIVACTNVVSLDVQGTHLGTKALPAMVTALKGIPSLKHVDIRRNFLGEAAVKRFLAEVPDVTVLNDYPYLSP